MITIDSPGHGKSTFSIKRLSIEVMADHIVNLLKELKIDHFILLGFSDGANIALKIAQKIPERFLALVVIWANFSPEGLKAYILIPVKIAYAVLVLLRFVPLLDRAAQRLSLVVNDPKFDKLMVKKITIQTLLLAGEYDFIKESHLREIEDIIPNAELKLPGISGSFNSSRDSKEYFNSTVKCICCILKAEVVNN
ncbi:MAG: alpha/beta hydrolase [Peptostreptococcaceae bacterium]|nr:alpha/beta hydrolase [Peptostreptococcaceae bacterium]